MKRLITPICLLVLMFPFIPMVNAQTLTDACEQLPVAIAAEHWKQVELLFQKAIEQDLQKAESFFWAQMDTKSPACTVMAWKLGYYHKDNRNYDKAHLFFNELFRLEPQDVDVICINAEMAMLRGDEKKALGLYEKALEKDSSNLSANIFIGNYYFMQTHREKQKLEKEYKKIKSPTKMQYAGYRNNLEELLNSGYAKAKLHLERVVAQFSSAEAKKTLDKIGMVEKEWEK